MSGGAIGIPSHLRWSLGGWCEAPTVLAFGQTRSVCDGIVELEVPCRWCKGCLRLRAEVWRKRANHEIGASKTWFWTGTYGGEARERRGSLTARNSAAEATEAVKAGNPDVTKWLKRLRKHVGPLRYMIVPELQRDGTVHWHGLIHTLATYRGLLSHWGLGFESALLVRDEAAGGYVTKYIAKQRLGRIRASRGYGRPQGIPSEGEGGDPTLLKRENLVVQLCENTIEINNPSDKALSEEERSAWYLTLIDTLAQLGYELPDATDLWKGRRR